MSETITRPLKHPSKVGLLQDAIDVSGKRLIPKNTSEKKIDEQVDLLMNINFVDTDTLTKIGDKAVIKARKNSANAREIIRRALYNAVNLAETPDSNFWSGFGSAPFFQVHEDKKKNGGVGMDTIFGDKFHDCHSLMFDVGRMVENLMYWLEVEEKNAKDSLIKIPSPYTNMDNLEDSVVAKKIKEEAKIFFRDKTKNWDERIKVFEKYGDKSTYIYEPLHKSLASIFRQIHEDDGIEYERHCTIPCLEVVEWWVYDKLASHRCKISFKDNKHHPKINKEERRYVPSDEAIERLYKYYANIVINEGTSEYTLDW